MGQACDQKRNACDVNYYAEKPNGNEFCQEHGQCVPTMGSNEFKCACADGVDCPQPVFSDESPKPESDGSEIDQEKVKKKKKGGSNTAVIVIVCLAVPVVLGGAGYMYIQQQKPKRTGKNAAETVPLMQVSSSIGKLGNKPHHSHHPASKGSASSLKRVTSVGRGSAVGSTTSQVLAESASVRGITSVSEGLVDPAAVPSEEEPVDATAVPSDEGPEDPRAVPSEYSSR